MFLHNSLIWIFFSHSTHSFIHFSISMKQMSCIISRFFFFGNRHRRPRAKSPLIDLCVVSPEGGSPSSISPHLLLVKHLTDSRGQSHVPLHIHMCCVLPSLICIRVHMWQLQLGVWRNGRLFLRSTMSILSQGNQEMWKRTAEIKCLLNAPARRRRKPQMNRNGWKGKCAISDACELPNRRERNTRHTILLRGSLLFLLNFI